MYCQKIFIIFYLILTNKFLLKRTKKKKLLIISVHERLGVASKQKEIYRYRLKWVEKNIGISDVAKLSIIMHPYLKINGV